MATHEFQRLCWRNIEMMHPAGWEMTFASPASITPQIILSDRRYERLKMQWRQLSYTPELARVIAREQDEAKSVTILTSVPDGWHGLVASYEHGLVIHAGKFFPETKTLAEIILFWNKERNKHIENKIMESIRPLPPSIPDCMWEAMGIKAKIPSECTLSKFTAEAGQITWNFMYGTKSKKEIIISYHPILSVIFPQQKITWETIKEFVEVNTRLSGQKTLQAEPYTYNGHTGVRIEYSVIAKGIKRLIGYKDRVVELAWACPVEERLYRLFIPFDEYHVLSEKLSVKCCGDKWKATLLQNKNQ